MRLRRLASAPARRCALGLILVAVVIFPGVAARTATASCPASQCAAQEHVRWSAPLTGSSVAQDGAEGTVPVQGQAYAAIGHGVAVLADGLAVSAYDARTGLPRWSATLTGMPVGSAVVAVRAWQGVITVGIGPGAEFAGVGAAGPAAGAGTARREVVLSATSGRQLARFPAAASGGAVQSGPRRSVVVGPTSVIGYSNATAKALWRVRTGAAEQAWRVDRGKLYVTVSARGEIGTSPVTAVRQISLSSGGVHLIKPHGGPFAGALSAVADGVLVFTGASGLSMYSAVTGRLTGQRAGAIVEGTDPETSVLYVDIGGTLRGVDPVTGQDVPGTVMPGPAATYGVRAGVALGVDSGQDGSAWGYSIAHRKVIWTAGPLHWPHYFVDLSGLGGSTDQVTGTSLFATCAQTGAVVPASPLADATSLACPRPRLVAIGP